MRPISITFFAHATTFDNESGTATGQADCALSPLGKEQAHRLRELTKNKTFDMVYCSDLSRSIDTATAAFDGRFTIKIDSRLRELDIGTYTGKTDAYVDSQFMDHIDIPFPEGESLTDVKIRMESFLRDIKESDVSAIAVVGHMFNQLALEVLLRGKTWKQALDEDWRATKNWQPGWEYVLD